MIVQRWTGHEARALRLAMRLSIRQFAAELGVNTAAVSHWEKRGTAARLRHETQQLLDTILQRAPQEAAERFRLNRDQPDRTAADVDDNESDSSQLAGAGVDRRHLLAEGALIAGVAISPYLAELLASEPHQMSRALDGATSEETLRYYETATEQMMVDYEQTGPVVLLAPALEHFHAIRRLIEQPQSVAARRRLTRIGARLGTLLGIFAYDNQPRARSWLALARRAAAEAGDRTLLAFAMATESLLDYYHGRHQAALETLAGAQRLLADDSSIVAAIVAARTARAYAALGDHTAALHALQQARHHLDNTTAEQRELYAFTDAQLAFYTETCHLQLGRHVDAQTAAQQALQLYEHHPHYMDPALVRLELATGYLNQPTPDVEAAATTATAALETLPAQHRTGPVVQRTTALARVLRQHPAVPAAREFVEYATQP